MGTVIVEQFNPAHGYWNVLYEVDSADFDPDAPITVNKYNGPYRTRTIGEVPTPAFIEDKLEEKVEVLIIEEEEKEVEDVKRIKKRKSKEEPKIDDSRW